NIVPYEAFEAEDGLIVIAIGNDRQFRLFCQVIGRPELAEDPDYVRNRDRVVHRKALIQTISAVLKTKPARTWENMLRQAGIPAGRVNAFGDLFRHPQILAREMVTVLEHPVLGAIPQLGSALKLSRTPVTFGAPPPLPGEHTEEILAELWDEGK
ncbi:MAG: CoA transferase, partial [Candidatus Carbobacillus sp.]|nr:CoA transferase [Candidatus Carbobacillus sp.]